MTAMFEAVFKKIESLPANPDVDKEEILETVQKIQEETNKENQANPNKLERWISSIAKMAPDILEVMAASLAGPVTGFTAVFKKIVDKARQESSSSG
jgi:chorismate mutase